MTTITLPCQHHWQQPPWPPPSTTTTTYVFFSFSLFFHLCQHFFTGNPIQLPLPAPPLSLYYHAAITTTTRDRAQDNASWVSYIHIFLFHFFTLILMFIYRQSYMTAITSHHHCSTMLPQWQQQRGMRQETCCLKPCVCFLFPPHNGAFYFSTMMKNGAWDTFQANDDNRAWDLSKF